MVAFPIVWLKHSALPSFGHFFLFFLFVWTFARPCKWFSSHQLILMSILWTINKISVNKRYELDWIYTTIILISVWSLISQNPIVDKIQRIIHNIKTGVEKHVNILRFFSLLLSRMSNISHIQMWVLSVWAIRINLQVIKGEIEKITEHASNIGYIPDNKFFFCLSNHENYTHICAIGLYCFTDGRKDVKLFYL